MIQAVIFDIYGTLVYYNLGDVDDIVRRKEETKKAFRKAAKVFKFDKPDEVYERWVEEINKEQQRKKKRGVKNPEVVIEKIWMKTLGCSENKGRKIALFMEEKENNPRLFPGVKKCLTDLKKKGLKLGILSNAQFYTKIMMEKNLKRKMEYFFDKDMELYSFRLGYSKPNPKGFEILKKRLRKHKIKPSETLFVGNDTLKDIWAAKKAGLKTCLYVCSQTYYKKKVKPDYKVKDLRDIIKIVEKA